MSGSPEKRRDCIAQLPVQLPTFTLALKPGQYANSVSAAGARHVKSLAHACRIAAALARPLTPLDITCSTPNLPRGAVSQLARVLCGTRINLAAQRPETER